MMAIKGIFYVSAQVSDLARSRKFYGDVLGWTLNTDEPHVAGFAFGTGYVVLLADPQRRGGEPAPRAGGFEVEVQVDDVDAEHARLRERGVAVGELCDQPWGERNFTFCDPDGYRWSYGQPTRAHG
jgi:catechol 2,3-dioxygenase-like lactoylglutathione lyase family enzyme